ncbi:ubiquitin carboxyl-terminal hydrolase MINDY-1 isoform X1 [Macaca thibetana thibetana]|uniref:ubiquitin carboxyl-terminal hydrolase MINDY-1 isoform X1 n=1 Tax=Macaca thibetana thibetana TaxID=257877 RepID=UPI0021BCDD51|nr:ubiquitin carboxyl-terminal hydrolase MINDY-1 isoform X1 [Macaca thibetana thibetana]XP_050606347.1 ubiquitin carboxyl-terminal hydrolase MINDY-1 isoform X1 [Macaca thibetana thibetana]
MEHHQPEDPTPGKAGTAEAAIPENHELLAGPHEHPQNADARDADGEAGERGQALLRGQCGDNLESPLPEASSAPLGPTLGTLPEVETMRACSMPQELPQSPRTRQPEPDFYCVKWIPWKGERTPIITQSSNGPCPLLAIMNILFLQWKVKLPLQKEVITSDELMAHLGNCLLSIKPQEKSEGLQLNFQQNVDDAITVLPKLATGLDVNVRFTGVSDFEYTPECSVFDLLGIPLYHGWLVDPQQSPEAVRAVGKLSYNQLVEKIITCKHSSDTNLVTEGLIAEQFLETTAAQLTYHGLCELTAAAKEDELSVFFRNNHFSTMTKHKNHLYLLVTDQGFLHEEQVVWESLHNVDGDSCFCDSDFHLSHSLGKGPGAEGLPGCSVPAAAAATRRAGAHRLGAGPAASARGVSTAAGSAASVDADTGPVTAGGLLPGRPHSRFPPHALPGPEHLLFLHWSLQGFFSQGPSPACPSPLESLPIFLSLLPVPILTPLLLESLLVRFQGSSVTDC